MNMLSMKENNKQPQNKTPSLKKEPQNPKTNKQIKNRGGCKSICQFIKSNWSINYIFAILSNS